MDRSGSGTGGRLDPALVFFKEAIYAAQAGRRSQAISDYVSGLRLRPDFMPGHFNLGQLYLQTGRRDAAINEFVTVAQNASSPPSLRAAAQLRLGLLYEHAGNLDWAVQEFTAVVRQQPRNPDALAELGSIAVRLGEMDNAILFFEKYKEVVPGNVLGHYNLAVLYAKKNRLPDALREFAFSAAIPNALPRSQRAAAFQNCGVIYDRLGGHTADAVVAYTHAVRLDRQNADAWLSRGIDEQKLQQTDEALRSYRAVLELDPRSLPARFNMGVILLQNHRYNEAASAFETVLSLDAKNAAAHSNLALSYVMMTDPKGLKGRQESAMTHYEAALAADPSNPANYAGLAYLHELKGADKDLQTAARLYEKLNTLTPHQPEILARLASVYARLKNWNGAIATAGEASRLQPEKPEGWFALANYQVESGHQQDAIATLRSFLDKTPNNVDVELRLASLLAATAPQHQTAEAIKLFQQIVQQQPDNLEALQGLSALLRKDHPQDAARTLQQAYDQSGQSEAWLSLGVQLSSLYDSLNRPDNVIRVYQSMIKRATLPNGPGVTIAKPYIGSLRSALAQRYLAPPHPNYAAAAQIEEDLFASNPTDPQPLLEAAQAYELGHQLDSAQAAYAKAMEHQPANMSALSGFLRLTLENNTFDKSRLLLLQFLERHVDNKESEAVFRNFSAAAQPFTEPQWLSIHPGITSDWVTELFKSIGAAHPGVASVAVALANVDAGHGRWQEALDIYTNLVRQHPTRADLLANKAMFEERLQKNDAALTDYNAAVAADKTNVTYLASRAQLEEKLQQRDAALADWKKAVEGEPTNASYAQSFIRTLEREPGHRDDEIGVLESLVDEAPDSPNLSLQLARLYTGPQAESLRIQLYKRLLQNPKLRQRDTKVLYYDFLGQSLENTGDKAGAISQYHAAQKINAMDALSQVALQRLEPTRPLPAAHPAILPTVKPPSNITPTKLGPPHP